MRSQISKVLILIILSVSFFYGEATPEMIEQWLKGDNAATKEIAIKEIGKRKLEKFVPQLKEILITEPKKEVSRVEPKAEPKVDPKKKNEKGKAKEKPKISRAKDNEIQKEKESEKLRTAAALALANFKGDKEIATMFLDVLKTSQYKRSLRLACIKALGDIGDNSKEVIMPLVNLLNEFDPELVIEVISSLERIGEPKVQFILSDVVKVYEDKDVRKRALAAIEKIGNSKVVRELQQSIEDNKKDDYKELVPLIEKAIARLQLKK